MSTLEAVKKTLEHCKNENRRQAWRNGRPDPATPAAAFPVMRTPRALPAGCSALTGGLESVITATPSGSTRYSALGAMLAKPFASLSVPLGYAEP
jgi:hypothetical protein